jgi:hypothetical protein
MHVIYTVRKLRITGKWQVLVADLAWKDNKCPSPAGCPEVTTKKDAFDLLYDK